MRTYHRAEHAFHPAFLPSTGNAAARADYRARVLDTLAGRRRLMEGALQQLTASADIVSEVALVLVETLSSGHKVLAVGNGGSAAEAQHFVAELVGRFKRERAPYAAIALTADSAILTAVANDYGYQDVFARQVAALGQPGDLLLAFSTSGESENVIQAASAGQRCDMRVVAITGKRSSRLEALAHITVRVPGVDTATVQELHMLITHILCDLTEQYLELNEHRTSMEAEREPLSIVTEDASWQA